MSNYHLLIDKFIDRTISPDERKVLEWWILESDGNMFFFKNRLKESSRNLCDDFDADLAFQRFSEALQPKKKIIRPFRPLLGYAAVLAFLLVIGFLVKQQLLPYLSNTISQDAIDENENEAFSGNDIIIKLADGTTKVMNSNDDTTVMDAKGNIVASKGGNVLAFDNTGAFAKNTSEFIEVFIPYGQIFKLKLSDGTLVWLNAGSKLRFPQNFVNAEKNRVVFLEGEAFFDVSKNKGKPFIVNTQELEVKVLGTKFNISSYETDNYIATTLVEGSVSVYEVGIPENGMQLTPSFQTNYDKFGNDFSKAKVDTELFTAWMQNRVVIDHLEFSEILVKLERRYMVKFVNKTDSLNHEIFKGEFVEEDIESVLKTISLSTPFNYEINQNIITITN